MEEGLVKDISNGLENVPICVDVGPNEDLPQKFHYIRCCISGPGVTLPEGPLYPGCECKDECSVNANCSCIGKFGPAYETKNDTLVMANSTTQVNNGVSQPVFECNSSCSCSLFCGNRLIQNGITTRLQVFKTGEKDWGLRTLDNIQKGHFVCEYAGEIISYDEAKKRTLTQKGNNYIIVIREHISGNQILRTHVDPKYHGNAGRFINHSCDPNLVMIPVRIDSLIPILALFSLKDIPQGIELTFDYSGGDSASENKQFIGQNSRPDMTRICHCKTTKCTGYLPCNSSLF
ncbi:histone-lysine N-methyltransferase SETMAR-like isoform X1 [Actinia tenebrosa]|uniref:Histone-lysine N-methyltransferase SETMAR-like isoform X1 n=1 Tax=Actinia tenebrosa TaxID=6105 RepID=A0A6P8IHE7_ACTTE|nr:histone-lysine N-methyltransferase SETMAR-like isoform X1 [Actinia tenebrosa]